MNRASDFRAAARAALSGNWLVAVLTGFVASLVGATIGSGGGGVNVGGGASGVEELDGFNINLGSLDFGRYFADDILEWLFVLLVIVIVLLFVFIIVMLISFVIGGTMKLGYAKYNLNLVDGRQAGFTDLFSQFHIFGKGFLMSLLLAIYTFLWSLLFIIPGIIKSYSYAMTPYILYENPGMTANEAISASRRVMSGNKWRLFCLQFSFIGWDLLCALPALIVTVILAIFLHSHPLLLVSIALPLAIILSCGNLFLRPYKEAAHAAFYRDVAGYPASSGPCAPPPPPPVWDESSEYAPPEYQVPEYTPPEYEPPRGDYGESE